MAKLKHTQFINTKVWLIGKGECELLSRLSSISRIFTVKFGHLSITAAEKTFVLLVSYQNWCFNTVNYLQCPGKLYKTELLKLIDIKIIRKS